MRHNVEITAAAHVSQFLDFTGSKYATGPAGSITRTLKPVRGFVESVV